MSLGFESSQVPGQIGWARLHMGKNAEAAESYERVIALGIPPGRSTSGLAWYNLACAYARLQRTDDAFRASPGRWTRGCASGVPTKGTRTSPGCAPIRALPLLQRLPG
ncbi:MAG TPA: hypothetical protein VG817_00830 [Gemmatimonadales bacterium]|nr:hypothetical protein [Gemmatimonadales bacterium]